MPVCRAALHSEPRCGYPFEKSGLDFASYHSVVGRATMPIDFTLTPEQQRLRADARAFAGDVLSGVAPAPRDLTTPQARFAATKPFYEQVVAAGFLRRLIPKPLGGEASGVIDMAVLAEEFHAVDANVSLTLLGTMLGLFPVLLGGSPDQKARFF